MKGSCFCGRVVYEITPPFHIFQYCHCSRCRKITGSAFAPNLFVPPEQFRWLSGEDGVGRYEPPETKYFASCFCTNCGSTLPWAVQGGMNIVVPTGTLDEDPGMEPQRNVFWGSRAEWLKPACELEKFDTLPPRK